MDILLAHPYKHHALNLAAGCYGATDDLTISVPLYKKGFGWALTKIPGTTGRKADGYYHPMLNMKDIYSPFLWQLKKLKTLINNPASIENPYDQFICEKLKRRHWKPKVLITLQDHMPRTSLLAAEMGISLWSDQILNTSPAAISRINRHLRSMNQSLLTHSEKLNDEILKVAKYVTVPSLYGYDGVRDRSNLAEIKVIPYGVDSALFDVERNISQNEIFVVARANSVRKGGHLLLKAIEHVGSDLVALTSRRVHFHFLGGLDNNLLALLSSINIPSGVMITHGFCANKDVPSLLAKAELFVMPTLSEGMSLAMTEAMQSGLPILTTKYSGVDYFVPMDMGGIVEDSIDSLSSGLLHIFKSYERWRNFGENCRLAARQHNWGIYEGVISNFANHVLTASS